VTRRTAPLLLAVLAAASFAGCASGEETDVARPAPTSTFVAGEVPVLVPGAPGGPTTTYAPGESGELANPAVYGDDEVDFLTTMVPHHTQALTMAALAPGRAEDERVLGLADRIAAAQGPEVTTMQAWLSAQGLPEADPEAGHDSHESMRGMATPEELFALESASGADFDRLFLELMTEHHAGALEMADAAVGARHPIVTEMVTDTMVSQGAEMNRMQELLADL